MALGVRVGVLGVVVVLGGLVLVVVVVRIGAGIGELGVVGVHVGGVEVGGELVLRGVGAARGV